MSEMITLKTDKENRRNRSVILKGRKCQFDNFGMVDVPKRYVEDLLEAGLSVVDEEEAKEYAGLKKQLELKAKEGVSIDVYDENQRLKIENLKLKEQLELKGNRIAELETQLMESLNGGEPKEEVIEEPVAQNEKEKEIRELLEGQSLGEMKEFCKEQGLPTKDWRSFKKEEAIKEYLVKELSK